MVGEDGFNRDRSQSSHFTQSAKDLSTKNQQALNI